MEGGFMSITPEYNLLEEPWLPVLRNDGTVKRLGILETLKEAPNIRSIAASNPMDRFAVNRFLLALLYWCLGNPPEDNVRENFPPELYAKLEENRRYFNLLGENTRFYQHQGARRTRPVTDLIQEIPTGNNYNHFKHSRDGNNGLCLSCCTLGLLRLPLFSVSGLPDLKSGINGSPPVYVFPTAKNLYMTLILNWQKVDNIGKPSWEEPIVRLVPGQPVPLLTGFTTLSRKVWLREQDTCEEPCFACGSQEGPCIRSCEYQSAGTLETSAWHDPHVIYYADKKFRQSHRAGNPKAPGGFRMDRPWNDLMTRLLDNGIVERFGAPITLHIIGFSSNKADNIDVWERTLEIREINESSAELLAQWKTRSMDKAFTYRMAMPEERKSQRSFTREAKTIAAMRPYVEHEVSSRLDEIMAGGTAAWQEAARIWDPLLAAAARSLAPGFTTAAVEKRRRILNARPYIQPPKENSVNQEDTSQGEGEAA